MFKRKCGLLLLQNRILEVLLNRMKDLAKHLCGFLDNDFLLYDRCYVLSNVCDKRKHRQVCSDGCVKRSTDGIVGSAFGIHV